MTAPETTGTRIQAAASAAERKVAIDLTGGPGIMRVSVGDKHKGALPRYSHGLSPGRSVAEYRSNHEQERF